LVLVATLIPFLPATAKLLQPLSVAFVLAFVAFVVEIVRDDCRAQPQQPCEPDQILQFVGTLAGDPGVHRGSGRLASR
jgi:hypothetical protein